MDFLRTQFTKIPPLPLVNLSKATVLVTGANAGIGLETARELLKFKPARMILAVRNLEKGAKARVQLEPLKAGNTSIEVRQLDHGSFESVRKFADDLKGQRVDIAILNVGTFSSKWTTTSDGYEADLQVNALAPALLSLLLLPNLRAAKAAMDGANGEGSVKPHLTLVSSGFHETAKFPERQQPDGQILTALSDERAYSQQDRYAVSKTVGILWVKELAARVSESDVIVNASNPGICKTGMMSHVTGIMGYVISMFIQLIGRSPDAGARCIVDAAAIKGEESHGQYLSETLVKPGSQLVRGPEAEVLRKRLWKETIDHLERAGQKVSQP